MREKKALVKSINFYSDESGKIIFTAFIGIKNHYYSDLKWALNLKLKQTYPSDVSVNGLRIFINLPARIY